MGYIATIAEYCMYTFHGIMCAQRLRLEVGVYNSALIEYCNYDFNLCKMIVLHVCMHTHIHILHMYMYVQCIMYKYYIPQFTRGIGNVWQEWSHESRGVSTQPLTGHPHLEEDVVWEVDLVRCLLTLLTQVVVTAVTVCVYVCMCV